MTGEILPDWYPELLGSVESRVRTGIARARGAVSRELVEAYWSIGRDILDRQSEEGWGARVIDRLSADLRERNPGSAGFSPRNLKLMRSFAAAWSREAIVQAPLAQLPWYHQIALLQKLEDSDTRLWYAMRAVEHGWSRDVLVHHIDTRFHEREGRAITNFARVLPPVDSDLAQSFTRDPYVFDFVGLDAAKREHDLEVALLEHIERFLLELGRGFAFVGRQYPLEVGGADFRIDLLFFHLQLRRYVVIELKVGEFDPSHVGQLNFYLGVVDDQLRHGDDEPSIGLLLCRSKDDIVVEYALRGVDAPVGVAEWRTALTTSLPAELADHLPTVAQLEAELRHPDAEQTVSEVL